MSNRNGCDILYEGHRCRLLRVGDDGLLFVEEPRYGLSLLFASMAVPLVCLLIIDWLVWTDDSLFRTTLNAGSFFGWLLYVSLITGTIVVLALLGYTSLQFLFGRKCAFGRRMLRVRCIPCLGLDADVLDVESVAICTSWTKGRVGCNVVLSIRLDSRCQLVRVNGLPVEKRAWSWFDEDDRETEEREIKAHRPLANLIAEKLGCNVEIRRSIGSIEQLRMALPP